MLVARRSLMPLAWLIAGLCAIAWMPGAFATSPPAKLDMWQPGDPGQRLLIRGRVSTAKGAPVANATLYVRQADGTGTYTEQYQGALKTADDGSYGFGTVLPGQYSSVKHIHIFIDHADFPRIATEIRFKGDPNLAGAAYDDDAIVVEEANINGETVLLGEFNIVLPE